MPKGVPNKKYTPEFKKLVIETMQKEKLSYSETARRFEVNSHCGIQEGVERVYLAEGPEGFSILNGVAAAARDGCPNNC